MDKITEMNSKAVSTGSHTIVVPSSDSEMNELQFTVSEPSFFLNSGNLLIFTLKRPADVLKSITRIGLCYTLENTGAAEACVGIGGGNLLSFMDSVTIYINGQKLVDFCNKWEINSTIKENLLVQHGESNQKRDQAHKSEFGNVIIDPATGCFQQACLAPAGSPGDRR